jgi:hypothetical protein
VHLGAVDRDHPDPNEAGLGAEREHLTEQPGQRRLVALAEARDRRVIRALVGADHARGDVLDTAAFDAARGALAERVAVEQQRDHHRRIVRRPPLAVVAVGHVKQLQIQRRDSLDNEPREMTFRQPLAQAWRQQQRLIAVARKEVLRHHEMVLTTPDGPALRNSHHAKHKRSIGALPIGEWDHEAPLLRRMLYHRLPDGARAHAVSTYVTTTAARSGRARGLEKRALRPICEDTRNAVRARVRLCPTACPTRREFPMVKPDQSGIIIRGSGADPRLEHSGRT